MLTDILSRTVWKLSQSIVHMLDTLRLGGLIGNIHCSSYRLIGKLVVDFPFVLIELFAGCYRWGATSEYWFEI